MRDRKIKRYGKDVRRQKQRRAVSLIVTVLIVLAAAAAGWFVYPSVYEYFTQTDFSAVEPQSSGESVSAPEESSQTSQAGAGHEASGRYAYLPPSSLIAGTDASFAQLAAQGFDGVVIDLKDASGAVLYRSDVAASYAPQSLSESACDLAAVLASAKRAGLEVSGRISAFRDPLAARIMYSSAVKYNYTEINWLDNSQAEGGKPWLNPNDASAQSYIIDLAKEAASAGVSRIILDGVQFPIGYSLHLATYGAEGVTVDKSAVLAGFLRRADAAIDGYGAQLAFMTDINGVLGVSEAPYGGDISALLASAAVTVIDLSPQQFGGSFLFKNLALASPADDPYNTVYATLALAELPEGEYAGWVSGDGVEEQMKAAGEYGIEAFVQYDQFGIYNG